MLSNLKIENIAIIESAEIEFSDGLNVLSGETGAGKSIIIDALSSILGERTSKELIRTGAKEARVTALFLDLSEEAEAVLKEMDIEPEDHSLVISRILRLDGRNVCKINGNPATVSMLKQIGKHLISIHGQHDSQTLLDSEYHYRYIDALGGLAPLYDAYYEKYSEYLALYRKFKALQKDASDTTERLSFLEYEIKEIEAANIQTGEFEDLGKRHEFFRNSEKIVRGLEKALSLLDDGDDQNGSVSAMFDVAHSIEQSAKYLEDARELSAKASELAYSVQDLREQVQETLYSCNYDPQEQGEVERRLAELQKIRAKYGQTEEEIFSYLSARQKEYEELSNRDEMTAELEELLEQKKGGLLDAAKALSDARKETAKKFENAVKEELSFLSMPNARLVTSFTHCKLNAVGSDEIEFLISTNPGEDPKPLAKIASGGELSRIMLAIQNVLSAKDHVQTMIFDEIDTGVSGSEADRIGRKLKNVSKYHQVLCITHSAQVASYADAHYKIRKEVIENATYTRVNKLDHKGRVEEIARIIGGEQITDLQRQSAEELLRSAKA